MSVAPLLFEAGEDSTRPAIRVFESDDSPADPLALAVLREGIAQTELAAPAAVLPDFHLKDDKEMPSSIAVATRHTIQTTLTCCSLNCGMALVALDMERPTTEGVIDFYGRVRERLPYPPTYRRDLTPDEVVACAAEGAEFAAAKFGVERIRHELPWLIKQLSRIRFGTIGRSNHFIELQQVEEILDSEAARLLGVESGQVTLQYHGGGGTLPGQLGVLFGARKRYT